MALPGTKAVNETSTTRETDGITVVETITEWNDTDQISVDYEAEGVDMYADRASMTSFDAELTDGELRALLADYGFDVGAGEV